MFMRVPAERRRHRFIKQRQVVIGYIDQFEFRVIALPREVIHPARNRLVVAPGPRASSQDSYSEHVMFSLVLFCGLQELESFHPFPRYVG
jgi:hypothetical protein